MIWWHALLYRLVGLAVIWVWVMVVRSVRAHHARGACLYCSASAGDLHGKSCSRPFRSPAGTRNGGEE